MRKAIIARIRSTKRPNATAHHPKCGSRERRQTPKHSRASRPVIVAWRAAAASSPTETASVRSWVPHGRDRGSGFMRLFQFGLANEAERIIREYPPLNSVERSDQVKRTRVEMRSCG